MNLTFPHFVGLPLHSAESAESRFDLIAQVLTRGLVPVGFRRGLASVTRLSSLAKEHLKVMRFPLAFSVPDGRHLPPLAGIAFPPKQLAEPRLITLAFVGSHSQIGSTVRVAGAPVQSPSVSLTSKSNVFDPNGSNVPEMT